MSALSFSKVAAFIFALVAAAHLARAVYALPVQIGAVSVPVWASWLGFLAAAAMCLWGMRSHR